MGTEYILTKINGKINKKEQETIIEFIKKLETFLEEGSPNDFQNLKGKVLKLSGTKSANLYFDSDVSFVIGDEIYFVVWGNMKSHMKDDVRKIITFLISEQQLLLYNTERKIVGIEELKRYGIIE